MSILSALLGSGKIYGFEQAFHARDVTSPEMLAAIREWYELYYQKRPDKEEDPCQRIPVVVVNKLTKTAFSEYSAAPAKASGSSDFIVAVLAGLEDVRKKAMQQALIGGIAWLKPLLQSDGRVSFSVISRRNTIPLGRDDMDQISSICTAEATQVGKSFFTLLERRTVDAKGWLTVENRLFRAEDRSILGEEVPLTSLEQYARLAPIFTYPQPVFSLGLIPLRTPLENCVDGSPDPVSVYAPAAGLIHNINRNEAQLNGEFARGESRIIASADLMKRGPDGQRRFEDHVFVGLDDDPDRVGVTIFSPALREASFLARKTEYLRNVESVIGLKRGLLSEVEAAQRTAREITSSEGDYNLTIIDFQEMWEKAVRESVRVCAALGRMYRVYGGPDIDPARDLVISWGNGILYDEDQTWAEYKAMVASGLLKPEIAVGWYFDMPTETTEDLERVRQRYMPEIAALSGGGDDG